LLSGIFFDTNLLAKEMDKKPKNRQIKEGTKRNNP
jgi:hypothetical protein